MKQDSEMTTNASFQKLQILQPESCCHKNREQSRTRQWMSSPFSYLTRAV